MAKKIRLQKDAEPFISEREDVLFKQSTTFVGRRYGSLEFRVSAWSKGGSQSGLHVEVPASQSVHTIGYQRFRIVNIERDCVDVVPLEIDPNSY